MCKREPFTEVRDHAEGKMSIEEWTRRLRQLGLEHLPLGQKRVAVA